MAVQAFFIYTLSKLQPLRLALAAVAAGGLRGTLHLGGDAVQGKSQQHAKHHINDAVLL